MAYVEAGQPLSTVVWDAWSRMLHYGLRESWTAIVHSSVGCLI